MERIQQLRRHYQQTHRERQGRYVNDDEEDVRDLLPKHYDQVCSTLLHRVTFVILFYW